MKKTVLLLLLISGNLFAEGRIVDQEIMNVTVIKAELDGSLGPSTNSIQSNYSVDISQCRIIKETKSEDEDCQFYNECLTLDVDCTKIVEDLIGLPLTNSAIFKNIKKTVVTYSETAPSEIAGKTVVNYISETFDCSILKSLTASRQGPFRQSTGLGFNEFFIPKDELSEVGTAIFSSGETAVIHEFASVVLCRNNESITSRAPYSFKPFMQFEKSAEKVIFRTWDTVPGNYWISTTTSSFNRTNEVLIPGTVHFN